MKEQIHTIPISEAFSSGDECPFCYIEREAEQRLLRLTLGAGASYMEPEMRRMTNEFGFCRGHYKKMFDYGNSLGNALIMQSYLIGMRKELDVQLDQPQIPVKKGLFSKKQESDNPLLAWVRKKNSTCFLCSKINYNMNRYYTTFFHLIKEPEFRAKVEKSKGLCMHHFEKLLESAQEHLPSGQHQWFYETMGQLMRSNLARVQEDLDWFVDKFDYRNASAGWKNSEDAVPRTMQKLKGSYPADGPYKQD